MNIYILFHTISFQKVVEGKTSQFISSGLYYPNTKIIQRHYKKRKL